MGGQRYWPFPPVDEVNVPAARVLCLPFGRNLYMSDSFALPRYVATNGMLCVVFFCSGMYCVVCLIVLLCVQGRQIRPEDVCVLQVFAAGVYTESERRLHRNGKCDRRIGFVTAIFLNFVFLASVVDGWSVATLVLLTELVWCLRNGGVAGLP